MPLLACPQLQPQAPTAPQKKHAPACLPKPATANTRRFANGTAPLQTRTGNLLQTRPANASRHSEPLTGHPELDSRAVPTSFPHLPQIPSQARNDVPNPQPPRQKKSRQPKPPGKVKRQPSEKNGHLKKLLVNSSRSLCTSINCSLCSLKLLSIAPFAELADCTLTSINSFLSSTIHKSL